MNDDVLSKRQNYKLWQSGQFGNKLRAWRSIEEWKASQFPGLVVLRTLMEGGGPCVYNLKPEAVQSAVDGWLEQGIPLDRIMVNEAAPDQSVLLQGEYLNDIVAMGDSPWWGYFYYSREKAQMRDALRASHEVATNLRASLLIQMAMTPSSYEDWLVLLDSYPGHALEVSIYDRCLGDTPGRNALVWEVRKY